MFLLQVPDALRIFDFLQVFYVNCYMSVVSILRQIENEKRIK